LHYYLNLAKVKSNSWILCIPKKQIANFMSECLILGAVEGKDVALLKPASSVPNGLKIS